ncbi:MAG: thioredoxin family protein [Patescibacteria group bacterium]
MKILKFGAIWCMHCIYIKSVLDDLGQEYRELIVEEFDADDHADKHKEFSIKDIPTLVFMDKNGNEVLRLEGAKDKKELRKAIDDLLKQI